MLADPTGAFTKVMGVLWLKAGACEVGFCI